jgi:hypothetical protein
MCAASFEGISAVRRASSVPNYVERPLYVACWFGYLPRYDLSFQIVDTGDSVLVTSVFEEAPVDLAVFWTAGGRCKELQCKGVLRILSRHI